MHGEISRANVDNRIMHSIGLASMKMGLVKGDDVQGYPSPSRGRTSTSTGRLGSSPRACLFFKHAHAVYSLNIPRAHARREGVNMYFDTFISIG